MMRDQIISQLFNGKNFTDCINKVASTHLRDDLRDDLRAEVALAVCEWPEDRIITLHRKGELEFYVTKVILYMMINKYSPFYKKYRVYHTEFISGEVVDQHGEFEVTAPRRSWADKGIPVTHIDDIQQREIRELSEDNAVAAIETLYWYDQQLIRMYCRLGNYRAIEAETGIPWESAYKTIQKALKQLRQNALQTIKTTS